MGQKDLQGSVGSSQNKDDLSLASMFPLMMQKALQDAVSPASIQCTTIPLLMYADDDDDDTGCFLAVLTRVRPGMQKSGSDPRDPGPGPICPCRKLGPMGHLAVKGG